MCVCAYVRMCVCGGFSGSQISRLSFLRFILSGVLYRKFHYVFTSLFVFNALPFYLHDFEVRTMKTLPASRILRLISVQIRNNRYGFFFHPSESIFIQSCRIKVKIMIKRRTVHCFCKFYKFISTRTMVKIYSSEKLCCHIFSL